MTDYKIENLIDSIYNPNGNQDSKPNVTLDKLEVEFLKGLASGKNLKEITKIIKNSSKTETFNSISMNILKKLEAFTILHAIKKVIENELIEL